MKKFLALCYLFASLISASEITLLRLPPTAVPPEIDGSIKKEEWLGGSMQAGGISSETKQLSFRKVINFIAYDDENFYFAQRSELPPENLKLKLSPNDRALFTIVPPNGKPVILFYNSSGKGTLPPGAVVRNRLTGQFWETEAKLPLKSIGISGIEYGENYGLQMTRVWDNLPEQSDWHFPSVEHPYGTLIPDRGVPATGFENFYSREPGKSIRVTLRGAACSGVKKIACDLRIDSVTNPIVFKEDLHLENPDNNLLEYRAVLMEGFPRTLNTTLTAGEVTLYKRSFSWEALSRVRWKNPDPPYQFDIAIYPSYKVGRVWLRNENTVKRKAAGKVVYIIKGADEKEYLRISSRDYRKNFFHEFKLPPLPEGQEYRLEAHFKNPQGNPETMTRTFGIYHFPWQDMKLGMDRIIVPPFKPLKVEGNRISALQTGYREHGGAFWDEIYAQGENILAKPIELVIDGKKFKHIRSRRISADPDRVVYENELRYKDLKLTAHHEYDYDGMCKVTLQFDPAKPIAVNSLHFDMAIKREYATLYRAAGARLRNNYELCGFVPSGNGEVWNSSQGSFLSPKLKDFRPYVWLGGLYKGLAWFTETPAMWSREPGKPSQTVTADEDAVTLRVHLVNRPCEYNKPFSIVMAFTPTPVKPRPPSTRYATWKLYAGKNQPPTDYIWESSYQFVGFRYDDGLISRPPNDDWSLIEFALTNPNANRQEITAFIHDYLKRNNLDVRNYSKYNFIGGANNNYLWNLRYACERLQDAKFKIWFQNPRAIAPLTKEHDMYVDEWNFWHVRPPKGKSEHFAHNPDENYISYMLYSLLQPLRRGLADGVKYDNVFEEICRDPVRCRITYGDENMPFYDIFAMRDLMKRTAVLLTIEKKFFDGYPALAAHLTDSALVPFTSFVAIGQGWEMHIGADPYQERFKEAYVYTNTIGAQGGYLPWIITQASGRSDMPVRSLLAMSFAHNLIFHIELQKKVSDRKFYNNAMAVIYRFGYGKPEVTVFDGWMPENPVKIMPSSVRSTVLKHCDGRVLLLIGNLGDNAQAKFDLSGLGGNYTATDVETGARLGNSKHISVVIPKYDYKMILLIPQNNHE